MSITFTKVNWDEPGVRAGWEGNNRRGDWIFLAADPDDWTVNLDGAFTLADLRQILQKAETEGVEDNGD